MSLARPWLALALAGALGGPLFAQDSDKVRLDDFELPTPTQSLGVEQVSASDPSLASAQTGEQTPDRALAQPARLEPKGEMPVQVSRTGSTGETSQLASTSQSRAGLTGSGPDNRNRVPGAVQRIGGQDRCDPQLGQQEFADCVRILERRADEFQAPAPAVLSPEQRLLGELRQPDERLARSSAAVRMRFADTAQPDADLQSNQELAALYLADPAPAQDQSAPPEGDQAASLAEALQNLGIEVITPPRGN